MSYNSLYKDPSRVDMSPRYILVDERIKKIIPVSVHSYSLDDMWSRANIGTSPDDYLLKEWIGSEKGQWVVKHTQRTPEFIKGYHMDTHETMVQIVAFLYEEDATMYHLKWS